LHLLAYGEAFRWLVEVENNRGDLRRDMGMPQNQPGGHHFADFKHWQD
jgi:hypothetical protein